MGRVPPVGAANGALRTDQSSRTSEVALSKRKKWLTGQSDAFRAAVNGAPLEECLDILIHTAIDQVDGTRQCAFYIANDEGTELRHVVGMSDDHARYLDGFVSGLAIDAGEPVIAPDVRGEPRWQSWL